MSDNRKTLRGTRRVSDVEMICQANHERRKWAEEHDQYVEFGQVETVTQAFPPRKARKQQKVMRTACTACTMATGGAAAFVGMGLCMGDLLTVVVGSLVAATFLICGTHLENEAYREGRKEYV